MKYALLILVLLITMLLTGLSSYHLFRLSDYNFSALLTYASYFSIVLTIYAITAGRPSKRLVA